MRLRIAFIRAQTYDWFEMKGPDDKIDIVCNDIRVSRTNYSIARLTEFWDKCGTNRILS
jgi:hypothetical protein